MELNQSQLDIAIMPMGFKWPIGMKEVHYLDKLEGKKAIFKDGHTQEARC